MRTRYFHLNGDNTSIKALIYEQPDHGISKNAIEIDARKICNRLKSQGHEAYIVGGAIRDLLLKHEPKDFDIATDAPPDRVRRLFRNSRIIGKRFRLIHVYYPGGKVHEVATFRSLESASHSHIYGTLNEDVMRRDFTLNALYFDTEEETVIDFVGGVKDIRNKVVKSVLPLETSFTDDPVRMLRAVKYAAMSGFRIAPSVGRRIKQQSSLLSMASNSRLSEELYKIIKSRNAEIIFRLMDRYKLIQYMLPHFDMAFRRNTGRSRLLKENFFLSLAKLDQKLIQNEISRGTMIRFLTEEILVSADAFVENDNSPPQFSEVVQALKMLLRPVIQPNRDVEEAVRLMFTERNLKLPRKRPRHSDSRAGGRQRYRGRHRKGYPADKPN